MWRPLIEIVPGIGRGVPGAGPPTASSLPVTVPVAVLVVVPAEQLMNMAAAKATDDKHLITRPAPPMDPTLPCIPLLAASSLANRKPPVQARSACATS